MKPPRSGWSSPLLALCLLSCACRGEAASERGRGRDHATGAPRDVLEVFAAASLTEVMQELGASFEAQSNARVVFNFAGSNVLAHQLIASSRGDVFVAADERSITRLAQHARSEPGTQRVIATNTLAIIAHPRSTFALRAPTELPTLPFAHLALADPEAVPAGRYARAYLASLAHGGRSVWAGVQARVAPAADVRAALSLVAVQEDVAGIVYRTDARAAPVRVLFDVPPAALPEPIRYHAVVLRESPRIALARSFVALLTSAGGQAILGKHGFLPAAP